tara:strand:+ start:330 stop:521 length:192 start_codon:yes stop_codon:yes gene_type:complete
MNKEHKPFEFIIEKLLDPTRRGWTQFPLPAMTIEEELRRTRNEKSNNTINNISSNVLQLSTKN